MKSNPGGPPLGFSRSVYGEFDGTPRIGNRRCSRMLSGKTSDPHVDIEAKLEAWLCISCRMGKKNMKRADLAGPHQCTDPCFRKSCAFCSLEDGQPKKTRKGLVDLHTASLSLVATYEKISGI